MSVLFPLVLLAALAGFYLSLPRQSWRRKPFSPSGRRWLRRSVLPLLLLAYWAAIQRYAPLTAGCLMAVGGMSLLMIFPLLRPPPAKAGRANAESHV